MQIPHQKLGPEHIPLTIIHMPSIVSLIKEATTRQSKYIYIFVFYLYVLYIVVCDQADRAHCLAVVLRSISVSRMLMISPIRLPSLFREANTIKTKAKSK